MKFLVNSNVPGRSKQMSELTWEGQNRVEQANSPEPTSPVNSRWTVEPLRRDTFVYSTVRMALPPSSYWCFSPQSSEILIRRPDWKNGILYFFMAVILFSVIGQLTGFRFDELFGYSQKMSVSSPQTTGGNSSWGMTVIYLVFYLWSCHVLLPHFCTDRCYIDAGILHLKKPISLKTNDRTVSVEKITAIVPVFSRKETDIQSLGTGDRDWELHLQSESEEASESSEPPVIIDKLSFREAKWLQDELAKRIFS